MKYCGKCGNQLLDEAVLCPQCGCMVEMNRPNRTEKKPKKISAKMILLWVAIAVGVVALVIGGIFLVNYLKIQAVDEQLKGSTFAFTDYSGYSIDQETLEFDYDGNCRNYSYFYNSLLEEPWEFDCTFEYEIFFKGDDTFVRVGSTEYRVIYDGDEISGLKDTGSFDEFERD